MHFTNDEAVGMLAVHFECLQNAAVAERAYTARYPNRRPCDLGFFSPIGVEFTNQWLFRPTFQRRRIGRTQVSIN